MKMPWYDLPSMPGRLILANCRLRCRDQLSQNCRRSCGSARMPGKPGGNSYIVYPQSWICKIRRLLCQFLDSFGESVGVFPVLPSRCDLREYAGEAWVRYDFGSGQYAAVELHRCGIMTKFQYTDDLLGESNSALSPTMELIDIQNQGISEGVRASASFRFMAHKLARDSNFMKQKESDLLQKTFGGAVCFCSQIPMTRSSR